MMKRFAFIDVQNTASTTRKLLGFLIDWHKLCEYLKTKWRCEKVFFYSGIDEGDTETAKEFESLEKTVAWLNLKQFLLTRDQTKQFRLNVLSVEKITSKSLTWVITANQIVMWT